MHLIEHIVEPDRLLLSWQPRQEQEAQFGSTRRIVAELHRAGNNAELVYMKDSDDFTQALEAGFDGYPGLSLDKTRYTNIIGSFMRRLPPKSRTDYPRFLEAIRLPRQCGISDFALLGYSGARLPDDDFAVIHPFDAARPPFEILTKIEGFRFFSKQFGNLNDAGGSLPVDFSIDPDNPVDPDAVSVGIGGCKAGYIARGLNQSFSEWVRSSDFAIEANIERINGTPDSPSVYLWAGITCAAPVC